MNKNDEFIGMVDSIKISVDSDNMEDYMCVDGKPFISKHKVNDKITGNCLSKIMVLNPNKLTHKYTPIHSFKEFIATMDKIYIAITIKDTTKVNLHRLDIALDSTIDFGENFKFLLFAFELLTINYSKADKWYTTNLNSLKRNTIIMKSRDFEICFYNKAEESDNRHLYKTRCEFRFLRISNKNYKVHFKKILDMIKNLECLIPKLEAQMNERLIALWKEESSCGDIKSFSEFVRKYNVYFYTNNIIKTVYSSSGLTGNYQKWLDRFRATNNELELWSYVNILDTKSQTFLCCTSS
ncbi:hypothetical protein [uncultured Clostridium sp.]|uniref:hypothetical protein n=1 Tax=uncultured Clostridium sp. TaxID=59620 RepID=UPI0027DD5C3B|nr:hypothetical protein [uncultured Clostridium sp.]